MIIIESSVTEQRQEDEENTEKQTSHKTQSKSVTRTTQDGGKGKQIGHTNHKLHREAPMGEIMRTQKPI